MLIVHHLNNSRSQRVLWLLEELGVPYEIVRYQREADMSAPPALRAIHPLGKSPVITDNGKTIAESGAIIEYLLETYGEGRLVPAAGSDDRLRFTYWLHYAEGSAMTPILLKLLFGAMPRGIAEKTLTSYVDPQLRDHMAWWEGELARTGWFASANFTAADIQMSFPLEAAARSAGLAEAHPNAVAFLARIHARPAYARALKAGGPYALAG